MPSSKAGLPEGPDKATHTSNMHTTAVLGLIDPSELQITLTHEHILVEGLKNHRKPNYTSEDLTNLEFKLENLGKIRYYP